MNNNLTWWTRKDLNKYDLLLINYVNSKLEKGFNNELFNTKGYAKNNRGDAFEMVFFNKAKVNSGLHSVSVGDGVFNNENVELKYVSVKSSASAQLKGTTCNNTIVAFNNGLEIVIKLIPTKDLIIDKNNKITYKNNINNGVVVGSYKA